MGDATDICGSYRTWIRASKFGHNPFMGRSLSDCGYCGAMADCRLLVEAQANQLAAARSTKMALLCRTLLRINYKNSFGTPLPEVESEVIFSRFALAHLPRRVRIVA